MEETSNNKSIVSKKICITCSGDLKQMKPIRAGRKMVIALMGLILTIPVMKKKSSLEVSHEFSPKLNYLFGGKVIKNLKLQVTSN